jgi:hypothetical protein
VPAPLRTSNQGSEDWRLTRAGSVTGSRVLDCMAYLKTGANKGKETKARQNYRLQLVAERLTGIPYEGYKSSAMDRGTELEGEARAAYELKTRTLVEQAEFIEHPDIDWCGCSVDGLVGEDGTIEIKCPDNAGIHLTNLLKSSDALYVALMGEELDPDEVPIPAEYLPQVQMGLWVTGRQWCDFVSYDPRMPKHLRLHIYRVQRNVEFITLMEREVVKFLDEVEAAVSKLLLSGEAPEEEDIQNNAPQSKSVEA